MTDVVFPPTLPGPSLSSVTVTERRLLSDTTGPLQVRGVQRDYLGSQKAEWALLSAAEAATFDAWWRDTLTSGGAWFASTWPAPQGWVSVVRRCAGTPAWTACPGGFWSVSLSLQVRGVGLPPNDCWTETFTGGITDYSLTSGHMAPYSMVPNPPALRTTGTTSTNNTSVIHKAIPPRTISSAALRFKLRSIGTDDACIAILLQDTTTQVGFNPLREAAYDPYRGAHVYIGVNDYHVSANVTLSLGVNYEMDLTFVDGGNTVCVIRNLDAGTTPYTTNLGAQTRPAVNGCGFYVDYAAAGALSETDYYLFRAC